MKEFFNKMGVRLNQYMYGRNGLDELGRAESVLVGILLGIAMLLCFFIRYPAAVITQIVLILLAAGLTVHLYFRILSKNLTKRRAENLKYTTARYRLAIASSCRKQHREQKKTHCFFKCPKCRQKVRVPKGRGKICITCPKCKEEFIKKT